MLAGEEGQRDMVLSSPIILYDYPQIAPESPGDLFDGTEIDEILALRILTMTDAEKLEVRNGDERARRILERTEMLPPEHFQKLHGALRGLRTSLGGAAMNEWEWQLARGQAGARSGHGRRRRVHRSAIASVCAREAAATSWTSRSPARSGSSKASSRTTKAKMQVAIVMDDDPGKDLGMLRQPGHRFFFNVEEIEPV